MSLNEMIKDHYTQLLPLFENAIYNKKQDITKYFGQDIMVIYNGHGGRGWDIRRLVGVYEYDENCFLLERYDQNGKAHESLLTKSNWFTLIVLPENIEKMNVINRNGRDQAPIRPNNS